MRQTSLAVHLLVLLPLFQLVNNAPGTASPIPGLLVLFGFNDVVKVTIAAILCGIVTTIVGYIGSIVFRKYPIRSADEIRGVTSEEMNRVYSHRLGIALFVLRNSK